MHRRKWDADTKSKIVIQGLQGKPRQRFRYVFGLISRPYRIIVTL
jgi:hypothetical protein